MAEGLLTRALSTPGLAEALARMSATLGAAGAPSTDPGASARGWSQASGAFASGMRDAQIMEEQRKSNELREQLARDELERKRREDESRAALSRKLQGGYMGGSGPAPGSVRAAQDAGTVRPGLLAGIPEGRRAFISGIADAYPEVAVKMAANEITPKETKPPQSREIKRGDTIVTQQYDPRTMKWVDIETAPRYKPQEGAAYKPLTNPAKLRADREYLTKELKLPETDPNVRAIDRELAKIGVPSGESMRMQEMVTSGERTMKSVMDTLMPDGQNVDMKAVASMWASLPKTAGRTTSSQMKEAASFILRLETGAQANEQEIANTAARYQPSPLDSAATAKDKLMRLQKRFETARAIAEGRSNSETKMPQEMSDEELLRSLGQ